MKDLSRRSRPLLIIVALWLLSWLVSLLVQEPYQRDTLLVCRGILLILFGIQLHARHRAKGKMSRASRSAAAEPAAAADPVFATRHHHRIH